MSPRKQIKEASCSCQLNNAKSAAAEEAQYLHLLLIAHSFNVAANLTLVADYLHHFYLLHHFYIVSRRKQEAQARRSTSKISRRLTTEANSVQNQFSSIQ